MAEDNLTAIQYGINDMRLEQTPIPAIKDNQVLIKIEVVGICGSDVHYLEKGRIGPFVLEKPMICGHEASGTVVKCGKDVNNLVPGDRVAIEPGMNCRKCEFCKTGRYHLCTDLYFCATPPCDGNLRRYYAHDADFCFKLPSNMDFTDGALMEPLAVGVNACKKAAVTVGTKCCILGTGPIGLVTLCAAKAMGATKVVCVGKKYENGNYRLDKALEMGADYVLPISSTESELEIVDKIRKTLGCDPDCSFVCAGVPQCTRLAMLVTKTGGVVILIGMDEIEMSVPLGAAIFREVDIRGIFRYVNNYPMAIEMVSSGKVDVKPIVTHHFRMEDSLEAFKTVQERRGNPIKVHIHVNPDWDPTSVPETKSIRTGRCNLKCTK